MDVDAPGHKSDTPGLFAKLKVLYFMGDAQK